MGDEMLKKFPVERILSASSGRQPHAGLCLGRICLFVGHPGVLSMSPPSVQAEENLLANGLIHESPLFMIGR